MDTTGGEECALMFEEMIEKNEKGGKSGRNDSRTVDLDSTQKMSFGSSPALSVD